MSNFAIKLENVSKYYKLYDQSKDRLKEALHPLKKKYHKPFYALRNLNLEIKKGEILGVVGRNGCGKSTLLKIITGVLQPNEGTVSIKGKITALLELGAGFNPEFTGIDNIQFYARVLGLTDMQLKEKLPDIISFSELGDFLYQPVKTYSSGMKSRLGFAVAVHIDPEILILDEVLAVGDALFKRKCYAKMEEFFKAGKTIIYVSHDANSINQLCTRAILIYNGKIIMDGKPKDVTKQYEKILFSKKPKSIVQQLLSKTEHSEAPPTRSRRKEQPQTNNSSSSESYIEGFVSKAVLTYGNKLAEVIDIRIENTAGEKVNVLISGNKYLYKYKLRFNEDILQVGYGLKLKTDKGVDLTSSSTYMMQNLENVQKGEVKQLSWQFTCNVLAGIYYFNLGVSKHTDNDLEYIVRVVDAMVFKVIAPVEFVERGQIYLDLKLPTIS